MAGMFDKIGEEEQESATGYEPSTREFLQEIDLEGWTPVALYALRARVDALLPPASMKTLDLSTELVRQYQFVSQLQIAALVGNADESKKASVMNAVNATLAALVKMQAEFYTAERLKNLESVLITCLEQLPKETLEPFFEYYEKAGIDRVGRG